MKLPQSPGQPSIGGKPRVAIFFWEGYLGVVPSLINAVQLLSAAGYQVDIVTRFNPQDYVAPPAFDEAVRVFEYRGSSAPGKAKQPSPPSRSSKNQLTQFIQRAYGFVDRLFLGAIIEWTVRLSQRLRFALFGLRNTRGCRYDCFIGIDTDGLVIATLVGAIRRVPIIYWSLELRFLKDFRTSFERAWKKLERVCNRRSAFTIIQDEERAAALVAENAIDRSRITIVPNGPMGPSSRVESSFFQHKFNLPKSTRIVLHMGRLGPDMFSLELAESSRNWPPEYALIFHERERRSPEDPYVREVREAGAGRVLLSLDPVPYDRLDQVVRSAQIGIVLYRKDLGPNYSLIAGASGKLAHYVRCGLPLICIDLPSLKAVIDKYRCGVCISDMSQVDSALQEIWENYDFYSSNAELCYRENYEFSSHFQQVLGQIERMRAHRSS